MNYYLWMYFTTSSASIVDFKQRPAGGWKIMKKKTEIKKQLERNCVSLMIFNDVLQASIFFVSEWQQWDY